MKRSGITQGSLVFVFGLVIWAVCGGVMYAGMSLASITTAIWVHLFAAPVIAAAASWLYFKRFNLTSPLATAAWFTSIVILMDFFVVALLIEQSFEMFGSLLGTWIPWALIFTATYFTGRRLVETGESATAVA